MQTLNKIIILLNFFLFLLSPTLCFPQTKKSLETIEQKLSADSAFFSNQIMDIENDLSREIELTSQAIDNSNSNNEAISSIISSIDSYITLLTLLIGIISIGIAIYFAIVLRKLNSSVKKTNDLFNKTRRLKKDIDISLQNSNKDLFYRENEQIVRSIKNDPDRIHYAGFILANRDVDYNIYKNLKELVIEWNELPKIYDEYYKNKFKILCEILSLHFPSDFIADLELRPALIRWLQMSGIEFSERSKITLLNNRIVEEFCSSFTEYLRSKNISNEKELIIGFLNSPGNDKERQKICFDTLIGGLEKSEIFLISDLLEKKLVCFSIWIAWRSRIVEKFDDTIELGKRRSRIIQRLKTEIKNGDVYTKRKNMAKFLQSLDHAHRIDFLKDLLEEENSNHPMFIKRIASKVNKIIPKEIQDLDLDAQFKREAKIVRKQLKSQK